MTRDQATRCEAAWAESDYSTVHDIGEEVIEEHKLGQGIYQFVDPDGKVIRSNVFVFGDPAEPNIEA
jgi:hypothetical protein